jgi:hydroxypyruvate isomerase
MNRRQFFELAGRNAALASMVGALPRVARASVPQAADAGKATQTPTPRKNRIKHSVCRWCYGGMSVDELARNAAAIGLSSVEILGEEDWPVVKKHGLVCAVGIGPGSIGEGWNRRERHEAFVQRAEKLIPAAAAAGVPNLVVFSGNRAGQPDSEGIESCAAGFSLVAPIAEKYGVTLVMEILNSKVDHGDYAFDHMRYGAEVIQKVGSPSVKILYDIYHAQIMEGDVIRTIRDHKDVIGHYHTGGVPGRHEIDETQELYYPAICRAIVETGHTGFLGQEFIPARDPMTSLRQAIDICDV